MKFMNLVVGISDTDFIEDCQFHVSTSTCTDLAQNFTFNMCFCIAVFSCQNLYDVLMLTVVLHRLQLHYARNRSLL